MKCVVCGVLFVSRNDDVEENEDQPKLIPPPTNLATATGEPISDKELHHWPQSSIWETFHYFWRGLTRNA